MKLKYKYEIASEIYKYADGKWKLTGIPKQVAMCESYEAAVKEYGPFDDKFPTNDGLNEIHVMLFINFVSMKMGMSLTR